MLTRRLRDSLAKVQLLQHLLHGEIFKEDSITLPTSLTWRQTPGDLEFYFLVGLQIPYSRLMGEEQKSTKTRLSVYLIKWFIREFLPRGSAW